MENQFTILEGNNLETLKTLPDNSVDSVVTDPPYGLSFMNKKWDYDVPSVELWKEVYRVLKPGGHLLSFGGTRTYHRMVVNIEDAGFEIRDQIMWLYGSGFPKSLNIGKAIDKMEGNEREVVGRKIQRVDGTLRNSASNGSPFLKDGIEGSSSKKTDGYINIEKPGSENSEKAEGWGTGLKPANEPICVARKPISENTIAENFIKWGVGGFNIDECRVGNEGSVKKTEITKISNSDSEIFKGANIKCKRTPIEGEGRFPANIILECICDEVIKGDKGEVKERIQPETKYYSDKLQMTFNGGFTTPVYNDKGDIHTNPECPCRLLDDQSGNSKSVGGSPKNVGIYGGSSYNESKTMANFDKTGFGDSGGASRFFYIAKTSKAERNMGLDDFEDKENPNATYGFQDDEGLKFINRNPENRSRTMKNNHPTVKPVNLMYYLCKLVTPNGGVILDPYMGSGGTGISALLGGFKFIGCELDPDYCRISEARISQYDKYKKFLKK